MYLLRRHYKKIVYSLALLGIVLVLYSQHRRLQERETLSWYHRMLLFLTAPVADGIHRAQSGVRGVFERYFFLIGVEQENDSLREAVRGHELRAAVTRDLRKEHERLLDLLNLKATLKGEWEAARVVAYPPAGPYRMLTIDKGSDDGVRRRAAVVGPEGLVGQVSRVSGGYSQVLLLTDPTSAVDVRIEEGAARGLVVGKIVELELDREFFIGAFQYLNQSAQIADGQPVVTSGLDGIFPPGLLVGSVRGVEKRRYDIFQKAEVVPAVDFFGLKEVLVQRLP